MSWFLVHLALLVADSEAVLPLYTPAIQGENDRAAVTITNYFNQGYNNYEILAFLSLIHAVVISLRTLKRRLKQLRLKRPSRRNESSLEDIVSAILSEMGGSVGSFVGYWEMTRWLRMSTHNLIVRRDTIIRALRVISRLENAED